MKLFGNFQGKHPKRVKMWSPLGRHDIHARGWKQDKWINDAPTRESSETGLKMWRQILTPTLTVHKGKKTSEEIYVMCIKGEETRPREATDDYVVPSHSISETFQQVLAFTENFFFCSLKLQTADLDGRAV
jgi:hypothetical protein